MSPKKLKKSSVDTIGARKNLNFFMKIFKSIVAGVYDEEDTILCSHINKLKELNHAILELMDKFSEGEKFAKKQKSKFFLFIFIFLFLLFLLFLFFIIYYFIYIILFFLYYFFFFLKIKNQREAPKKPEILLFILKNIWTA